MFRNLMFPGTFGPQAWFLCECSPQGMVSEELESEIELDLDDLANAKRLPLDLHVGLADVRLRGAQNGIVTCHCARFRSGRALLRCR